MAAPIMDRPLAKPIPAPATAAPAASATLAADIRDLSGSATHCGLDALLFRDEIRG